MISSMVEKALLASIGDLIDNRFKILADTTNAVEKGDLKPTNRLCGRLTTVIASLKKDACSADQLSRLAGYAARVRAFNPRRNGRPAEPDSEQEVTSRRPVRLHPPEYEDWLREQTEKKAPATSVSDGFVRGFVDPIASVDRIRLKYSQLPAWTAIEQDKLLSAALGEDVPVDEHSVRQLFLSIAYYFKERLGAVDGSMSPQATWITACICAFVNRRGISIPTPNCFANVIEELAFRS